MYLRASDLLVVYTKEECLDYLRELKQKNPDYIYSSKDKTFLDKLCKEFNRSKKTVVDYMLSLNMYEVKKFKSKEFYDDIDVRLDNYLVHIWSKRDESRRDSIVDLSAKFGVGRKYISDRIKKLGLESYILSVGCVMTNKNNKKYEERLEYYNKYYLDYKQNGSKISYVEIANDLHFGLKQIISDIKRADLVEMIQDIKPKMSKTKRKEYYLSNRQKIEGNVNIVELCCTVGVCPNDLRYELSTLGIVPNKYRQKQSNSSLYYTTSISNADYSF